VTGSSPSLSIMNRRGLAGALVAMALLGGCASFAEEFDDSSRGNRADSSASASTSRSGSTSEATSSSAPSSTTAAPTTGSPDSTTGAATTGAATTGAATTGAATTGAATTAPPPPAPAPVNKPSEVGAAYGTEPWAVYLIAAQDYSAGERSRMEAVHRDLQAFGYRGFLGTLCDEGAEAAGVDPYGDAVVIYFRTQAEAQQFITLWNRPVVGSAQVLIICGD
jgi:cell division septation protein DedD